MPIEHRNETGEEERKLPQPSGRRGQGNFPLGKRGLLISGTAWPGESYCGKNAPLEDWCGLCELRPILVEAHLLQMRRKFVEKKGNFNLKNFNKIF